MIPCSGFIEVLSVDADADTDADTDAGRIVLA